MGNQIDFGGDPWGEFVGGLQELPQYQQCDMRTFCDQVAKSEIPMFTRMFCEALYDRFSDTQKSSKSVTIFSFGTGTGITEYMFAGFLKILKDAQTVAIIYKEAKNYDPATFAWKRYNEVLGEDYVDFVLDCRSAETQPQRLDIFIASNPVSLYPGTTSRQIHDYNQLRDFVIACVWSDRLTLQSPMVTCFWYAMNPVNIERDVAPLLERVLELEAHRERPSFLDTVRGKFEGLKNTMLGEDEGEGEGVEGDHHEEERGPILHGDPRDQRTTLSSAERNLEREFVRSFRREIERSHTQYINDIGTEVSATSGMFFRDDIRLGDRKISDFDEVTFKNLYTSSSQDQVPIPTVAQLRGTRRRVVGGLHPDSYIYR